MRATNDDNSKSTMIRQRLHDRFGHEDVGNGTALSAALASALELDLRMSGAADGTSRIAALTDQELDHLAHDLVRTIENGKSRFTLPLGTNFASHKLADLTVGSERWLLDASRPGLHPMQTMRRDAHGANLRLLRSHIRRLTQHSDFRALGLPSAARIVDTADHHLLHFAPCEEAGGVVLQRSADGTGAPRFRAALPIQIRELAESIVTDMQTLWNRREAIKARATQVRELAEAQAAKHGAAVQLVAVDLELQRDEDDFDMYVHYHAIDEAMRPGAVLGLFSARDYIDDNSLCAPAGVTHRKAELEELRRLGADGRIDEIAAGVAAAAPRGAAAVFAELAESYDTMVELPTSGAPMCAILYWGAGKIKADIMMGGKLDWWGSKLILLGDTFPETVVAASVGRRVDSFVQLPFACPCLVKSVEPLMAGVRLELEVGEKLIHLSTGRIWDEPGGRR